MCIKSIALLPIISMYLLLSKMKGYPFVTDGLLKFELNKESQKAFIKEQ